MISEPLHHALSFVMRYNNHFTGQPIINELPVRLNSSFIKPVQDRNGCRRQTDGTYRFINLPVGVHEVLWRPPLETSYAGWVTLDPNVSVTLPLANPSEMVNQELWPHPQAAVEAGVTAVRGRLIGPSVEYLEVRISNPSLPNTRFTFSNRSGDFLFLLPQPMTPNAVGAIALDIVVDGGARAVSGGSFVPSTSGAGFIADQFFVLPGMTSRVDFNIS